MSVYVCFYSSLVCVYVVEGEEDELRVVGLTTHQRGAYFAESPCGGQRKRARVPRTRFGKSDFPLPPGSIVPQQRLRIPRGRSLADPADNYPSEQDREESPFFGSCGRNSLPNAIHALNVVWGEVLQLFAISRSYPEPTCKGRRSRSW